MGSGKTKLFPPSFSSLVSRLSGGRESHERIPGMTDHRTKQDEPSDSHSFLPECGGTRQADLK